MSEPLAPLLPLVAAGDPGAVRACIDRYGAIVWSLVRRSGLDTGEAEDVVQEVFLDVWRSAARFDARVASEATFVAMVARRRIIDRRRSRQRRPLPSPVEPEELSRAPSLLPAPEVGAEAAKAARALDQLRPEQREVLVLTACEGLSHDEVSQQTGMALGTVKTHARRGLHRLRELLGAAEPTDAYVRTAR